MKQSRSNHVHSDHQYYARNKKAERQIMREVWTQQMQEKRERQLVQEAQGTVQPEERSWNGNKTKLVPGPDHYLYYDKVRELQDRVVDQAARRAVDERIMSGVEKRMTMFDR
jgi:predicted transcriptional regulator